MRYDEVKKIIETEPQGHPSGLTWVELKARLNLPYRILCPEWTRQLEEEIGLVRKKGAGRAYKWTIYQQRGRNV